TLASGLAKAIIACWLNPGLRLAISQVHVAVGRQIYGYGVWHFLLDLAIRASTELSLILVGTWLTMQAVTSSSIGLRLVMYAGGVVGAVAGVFTPVATAFDAAQDLPQQQRLFVEGGRWCMAAGLFFLGVFVLLGKSLITLWMGPGFEEAAVWLVIMA